MMPRRAELDRFRIAGCTDSSWAWPAAFMGTNAARVAELGYTDEAEAKRLANMLDDVPSPARQITPPVAEVIARRS